ncbi:MAG: VCBS repeat-containing protein [Saprospiraceae bacterium]
MRMTGNGELTLFSSESNPNLSQLRTSYDFNYDDNIDIVTVIPDGLMHLGDGTLNATLTNPSIISPDSVSLLIGDVNGDGIMDLFNPTTYNGNDWTSIPYSCF